MIKSKLCSSMLAVAVISTWGGPAMAYIDPGSGSAIMSALLGLFVAMGVVFKTYWYKFKSLFSSKAKDVVKEESTIQDSVS